MGKNAEVGSAPFAFGKRTSRQPLSAEDLTKAVAAYEHASVGQQWQGPCGITDDGIPWIVVVTRDSKRVERYKRVDFSFIAWRWNVTPSCPVSLTVVGGKESRPFARWMAHDRHPVVEAIRRTKRFLACVAHPAGSRSGWLEETFEDLGASERRPEMQNAIMLDRLWTFPRPGLPGSVQGVRYDPFPPRKREEDEDETEEDDVPRIPLWEEPIADLWHTLNGKGPWSDGDLDSRDQQICAWARQFHHKRCRMAGFVQVIKERQTLDGERPLFGPDGRVNATGSAKDQTEALIARWAEVRDWLLALAGPDPCAERAHEAALRLINVPAALLELFKGFGMLGGFIDEDVAQAIQTGLEAAFLDTRITALGTKRPWLQNIEGPGLALRTMTLDRGCEAEDLDSMWRSTIKPDQMIDAGDWMTPQDMPAPLHVVNEVLKSVRLEGSAEEARRRVDELLLEAQEARQWTVPWGARVQITFGPFVAMRIYERQGEFSCVYVDERERYLHIAVGLWGDKPQMSDVEFVREADDSEDLLWNEDAMVSMQLITAAILRDFLVVENRETVFSGRPFRKRVAGRDIRTVIYLPRVRYDRIQREGSEVGSEGAVRRSAHQVGHHFRRAAQASAAQRFLAQKYGLTIPEGFTFVKPHRRGGTSEADAIRVYRSRSASRMLFEEVATAPEGTRPAWFEFEKACARLLKARGMSVIHQAAQRDGDGGVDLFATDSDGTSWVVQCKCWALHRAVGPDVVRELVGTIERVDRGGAAKSKGMIITTSTLTKGASEEARDLGFEVIDGEKLAEETLRGGTA